jgi:cell division protease FtsH
MVEDAHQTSKDILSEHREQLDTISRILLERETIEAEEFIALLEGKPEDEVFSEEEEAKPPEAPPVEEKGTAREGPKPRPRPRPGLAGGGAAEMRANDS